jgi:3-methyladenine DNA glycosylase AlkD
MSKTEEDILQRLFALQDPVYRAFTCKLTPSLDPGAVIGVRTPQLRKLAKEMAKTPEAQAFLRNLPHRYYEENNLHGFLIETIGDYDAALGAVEAFLPYVDNWATCDQMTPKVFRKNLPGLYERIKVWLKSDRTYTVRFGIGMLLGFYLDGEFRPEMLTLVANIRSEEYYVNMMIAWYFATALAKQYEAALPYIEQRRLPKWTHNKAIQKAVESNRISDETKTLLRTLKMT